MQKTYRAILRGDRLEWIDDAPNIVADQPIEVTITILEKSKGLASLSQQQRITEIFEQLAALEVRSDISDPAAWEREIRKDRPLPGRED